jgi:hypothetical protein
VSHKQAPRDRLQRRVTGRGTKLTVVQGICDHHGAKKGFAVPRVWGRKKKISLLTRQSWACGHGTRGAKLPTVLSVVVCAGSSFLVRGLPDAVAPHQFPSQPFAANRRCNDDRDAGGGAWRRANPISFSGQLERYQTAGIRSARSRLSRCAS